MKTLRPLFFLLLFALPAALFSQTLEGGVFEVGVAAALTQGVDVAMNSRGGFVVAWTQVPRGETLGAFGRVFAENGSPRTGEIRLMERRLGLADSVRLAMMDDSSFVAVIGQGSLLQARRFNSKGVPLGSSFIVARERISAFEVESRGDGSFVVAWIGSGGLSVRSFGPNGQPLGPTFLIEPFGTPPQLAVGPEGSFLVIWDQIDAGPEGHYLAGQLFGTGGTPQGDRFRISESQSRGLFPNYDSAVDTNGDFLVTWFEASRVPPTAFARRYAPDGSPLGGPVLVDHRPAGRQIAVGSDSAFVSIWETTILNNPRVEVVIRQSAASGAPLGPPVILSPRQYQYQFPRPVIAGNGTGRFVAAWLGKPRRDGNVLLVRRFRTD